MTQSTPPPEASVTDVDAYLRQYRDKFTRDAMAARLIEAGHEPAAIEAALARLEAQRVAAVDDAVRAADADVAGARRLTRIIVLLAYALLSVFIIVSLGIEPADLASASNLVFIVLLVLLGALLAWIIGRTGSTASMVAWSVVAVIVGMPLAFLGACLASVTVG
jgi:hypothetical protein